MCAFIAAAAILAASATVPASAITKTKRGCPRSMTRCPLRLVRAHTLLPGLNDDWQVRTDDVSDASLAGARVIRFPLDWATVQPHNGSRFDWSEYDRLFAAAEAQGLGVILDPTGTPCWARGALDCFAPDDPSPPDPAFDSQWELFVKRAVRRYADLAALEVWNEPNSDCFWDGGPDPARYAQLLQEAYQASKSARPDVPVLFGGLVPEDLCGTGQFDYVQFLRDADAAGATGYYDGIALHPYPVPFGRLDYRERVLGLIARVRKATKPEKGQPVLPIWITELGISTQGDEPVDELTQAQRLQALYKLLARVPHLPVVVIHRLFDVPGRGGAENGFGLLRSDLSPKPAYEAMRTAFSRYYRLR